MGNKDIPKLYFHLAEVKIYEVEVGSWPLPSLPKIIITGT